MHWFRRIVWELYELMHFTSCILRDDNICLYFEQKQYEIQLQSLHTRLELAPVYQCINNTTR